MGILKNLIARYKEKKEREKSLAEDIHIQKRVMEREKNANERELERYYEEMRQRRIESQLKRFRKQKTKEAWSSNIFTKNKNMFAKDKCYLGRYYYWLMN